MSLLRTSVMSLGLWIMSDCVFLGEYNSISKAGSFLLVPSGGIVGLARLRRFNPLGIR